MDRPRLNYDVLHIIMSFSDKPTLSCLMRTCKELYRPATRYILKGGAWIENEEHAVSLLPFMRADAPYRASLLRVLRIDMGYCGPVSADTASLLDKLFLCLASAGCLNELTLWHSESLLRLHPDLSSAFARLSSVKHLQVYDVGQHSAQMLSRLQTSLISAHISFQSGTDQPPAIPMAHDPTLLLHHSRHTLCNLITSYSDSPTGIPTTYLGVTDLSLNHMEMPDIAQYVQAFPRLLHLILYESNGWDFGDQVREGYRVQRRHNQEMQRLTGSWPKLDLYEGSIVSLYHLGITCQISALILDDQECFPMEPEMLIEALEDARPEYLQLVITGTSSLLSVEIQSVFTQPSLRGLSDLELHITLRYSDRDADWACILDRIASNVIAPLPALGYFELHVDCIYLSSPFGGHIYQPVEEVPLERLERELMEWDATAFAERACKASRKGTLRMVSVVQINHRVRDDVDAIASATESESTTATP
ncbi:hypothetical protein FKP32DRAFT_1561866 [Trametes sanguinea]|nr:hypothetical protein FKP32DRAFT_1561866 [Trametes sanguinea]